MINYIKKLAIYVLGMCIIALGINISKLSGLGIAPVSSIPGVLNKQFPSVSLGSMVIIVYCLLVLAQLIVLGKHFKIKSALGIPVALVFGLLVDFLGTAEFQLTLAGISLGIEHTFSGLLVNFYKPEVIWLRLIYLAASIVIIGIGVYIYLLPKLTPMPAEGLAAAISQKTGKLFGNCKSAVDISLILIASILQTVFFGFGSFLIGKGVVGIGTVLAAVFVGQVVKTIAKLFKKK